MADELENCSNFMLAEASRVVDEFDESYTFTIEDDGMVFEHDIPMAYFDPTNFLNGVATVAAQDENIINEMTVLPSMLVLTTEGVEDLPSGYTFTIYCSGSMDQRIAVHVDGQIDISKPLVTLRGDSLDDPGDNEFRASAHLMLLRDDDAESGVVYRWVVLDVRIEREVVVIPRELYPTQLFPQLLVGYDQETNEWIMPAIGEAAGKTLVFFEPDGVVMRSEYDLELPKLTQMDTEYLNRVGLEYRMLNASGARLHLKMTPSGIPEGPYFVPEWGSIADGPMTRNDIKQYFPYMVLNTETDTIDFDRMDYEAWSPDFNTVALVLPWLDSDGYPPTEPFNIRVMLPILENSGEAGLFFTGVAPLNESLTDYQVPILLDNNWTELTVTETNRVVFFKSRDQSDRLYKILARIQVQTLDGWADVFDHFYSRDDINNELMPRNGTVELKRGGYSRVMMTEGESNGGGGFYWVNWTASGDLNVDTGNNDD